MGTRRTGRLIVGLACAVLVTASAAETPPTTVDRDVWTIDPTRADYTAGATATLACEADGLSVVSTNAGLTIRFANFPGARPFAGMRELVVEGACAYPGTLVAEFVSRVQSEVGRPLRLKTTFDGRVARLPLDARFDGFWRLSLLQLWPRRPKEARGLPLRWQVRRVAATFDGPALRQVELAVRTDGRAAAVWRAGDPPAKGVLANPTAVDVPLAATLDWRDFGGKGPSQSWAGTVPARGAVALETPPGLDKGIWYVTGRFVSAGATNEVRTSFGVIDRHAATPRGRRGAHFRIGVNYHMSRYTPSGRADTLDALALAGCKLVRASGFAFNSCCPREGVFDWSKSDVLMAELVARGISENAIFSPAPNWAKDPAQLERLKGRPRTYQAPSRPGLLRDFAERLAARYGEAIDYYELGNEWDLVPTNVLSEADALRLHREAWEGLRRGCPAAKMMCNGWTGDMTFNRPGIDRIGFQERYMRATRDMNDFHPIHLHSRFPHYVAAIRRFLAQRREQGLEGIPWYSNETALTTHGGREAMAARHVWKKPVFAWAHGSCDYIWYNLKATGWDPDDSEQAYGLLTADLRPRATYCAYSALVKILQGLSFDAILSEEADGLYAYRFRGEKDGFAGCVLVGWNEPAAKGVRTLRIRTDATRAVAADLFNRETPMAIDDGVVTWTVGTNPGALVLVGATHAVPDAASAAAGKGRGSNAASAPIRLSGAPDAGRAPDFELKTAACVHDLYEADPATADRVWKGPSDCSAQVWLMRAGPGRMRIRVAVVDDVRAPGDRVTAFVRPAGAAVPRVVPLARVADGSVWSAETEAADVFAFDVRVEDDDGRGVDAWLSLSEGRAAPTVRLGNPDSD